MTLGELEEEIQKVLADCPSADMDCVTVRVWEEPSGYENYEIVDITRKHNEILVKVVYRGGGI
jgi:lipoate synthase